MKKYNVIWIHSHFLYWMGGTKFVFEVVEKLKKHQNVKSVSVLVEDASNFAIEQYQKEGIELHVLSHKTSVSYIYWLFLPYFLIRDIVSIRSLLEQKGMSNKNTVVISGMFPMNVVAAFLPFRHIQNCFEPFAFFYDHHFMQTMKFIPRILLSFLAIVYAPIDKWATKKSSIVLTLNSTTQRLIQSVYRRNSVKTQVGVDATIFRPFVSKRIKDIYAHKKIVIHSTDYSSIKRTDLVLRAFANVLKAIPEAQLLITTTIDDPIKKEPYAALAQKLGINDHVEFLGFVPITDLPQYYSLALVMVQGAYSEKSGTTSMSMPVKEAMACQTPAIRPDIGGDDVEDGITGFLVDPRRTKEVAQKIIVLLKDPSLSKKMGKKAQSFINNTYTWENTADVFAKYLDLPK